MVFSHHRIIAGPGPENADGIYVGPAENATFGTLSEKRDVRGRQTGMSHETNMLQHLIRFVKGTVADVVGRESGPSFKFAFDMVYGILKSSSVVLNDIGLALGEKPSLKAVNNKLYSNLMKGLPDTTTGGSPPNRTWNPPSSPLPRRRKK